jgi:hypothetical protein
LFKDVPVKIVIPIIVVTWILSLISCLAIVSVVPSLFGIGVGKGSITSDKIADGAVITVTLANGSVTSEKILDGTITAVDLADGSVITIKIANGAVTTPKIADSAIVTVKLADNAVTSAKIADHAITTVKLADGSVTSAQILDGTITAADLGTGSVTSIKIADGTITTEKLADFSVTALKLAADAIPHNETSISSPQDVQASSTTMTDMPDMSVQITLTRNSTLFVMFSARATAVSGGYLYVQAMVDSMPALPSNDYIILTMDTNHECRSFIFYYLNATAGTHTVHMQWRIYQATYYGYVAQRSLVVMALPT